MVVDDAALIVVLPGDSADTLAWKVLETRAKRVQLLVPDGVTALQTPEAAEQLRQMAERAGIDLLLISSDQRTLNAAQRGRLQTVLVRDTRVVGPPPPAPPASPFATQVLEREPPDAGGKPFAEAVSAGDAAFLQALDDLDVTPARRPAVPDEDDPFAALDSLTTAIRDEPRRPAPPPRSPDDDFADVLDSLNAAIEDAPRRPAPPPPSADDAFADALDRIATGAPPPQAAPRRVRPEDIQLTPDEIARANKPARGAAPPARRPAPAELAPRPARPPARGAAPPDVVDEPAPRRGWLVPALILGLILLLLAIGAVLFLLPGARVVVSMPVAPGAEEPVEGLPVPLIAPGSPASATAVEAQPIRAPASFSVQGEVREGTLTPSGTAGGTVLVQSLNPQAIRLPAGTEFIAVQPGGQEVPFVSTAEVLVPPSTTSDTGAQIITSRGQATVPVIARSPGSASNVDANSIRRMIIPGGTSFEVATGTLQVRHDPLTGGSEQEVRVVKDSDVQQLLGAALTGLNEAGRRQLADAATAAGLSFEPTTTSPSTGELVQLQRVEYTTTPAIGEVLDVTNPTFTLTVQAEFSGLALPAGRPLPDQIEDVMAQLLLQAGRLKPGDCKAPNITGWGWDGAILTLSGTIGPDPACGGGLDENTRQLVATAVRGRSRAEATAALDALVAAGAIRGYTLPELERMPTWDWQISVVESR